MFWANHEPTRSTSKQYMSVIFYHSDKQRKLAESSKEEEQKKRSKEILTRITAAETFYDAEE